MPDHARTRDRTQTVSVHRLRRTARRRERKLQAELDALLASPHQTNGSTITVYVDGKPVKLPTWARGVRVEKAGLLQWTIVATEHVGR